MASNPPGDCCTTGHIHTGEPKGTLSTLGGIQTYIVHPSSGPSKSVVYFLTDVLGHVFINAQLLADCYASKGYTVIMPDLFSGDSVFLPGERPEGFNIFEWLKNHMVEHTEPIVHTALAALKEEYKPEKIFLAGYCFGGKYVTRLLATGEFAAGFCGHPSFVAMEELAAIKGPLSIAAAETDTIFTTELRRESEDKLFEIKATYQLNLYSRVEHGFSVKGNMENKQEKYAKEAAFKQAVDWFEAFA